MKKILDFNRRFTKFIYTALFIIVLSTAAFGATFTVTKTADTNDAVCDADCSLREAIAAANAAATDDVIDFNAALFSTGQTITLGGTELTIANNGKLTINGTGANLTAISGNTQSRVFNIGAGVNAAIINLKITGGFENQAGGIINYGTLSIINSLIENNRAALYCGGIYNADVNATLIVADSIFKDNSVNDYEGGGILSDGTLNVSNSTFINNVAGGNGGGISSRRGITEITNTTFTGNRANNGGGISISYSAPITNSVFTIRNSLFSNNNATTQGGGINVRNGTLDLTNVTITANSVTVGDGGGIALINGIVNLANGTIASNVAGGLMGIGGGVYNESGAVNTRSSIIAGNTAGLNGADFRGTIASQGYNLIGNTNNTTITGTTTGNIIGQDPMLGVLQDNGGRTQTRALLAGSPAIDAAAPNNFPVADQRGASRPLDGDLNGSPLPDIGAFEAGAKIVTKIADTNDGVCDADCSLREAVAEANNTAANDAILFSSLFNSPQTIVLTNGQLSVNNNGTLTINGSSANMLTVSGNNASRVFLIQTAATAVINNIKISTGKVIEGQGGGILNNGTLTLGNAILSDNSAGSGGAIYNTLANTVVLLNSVLDANTTTSSGGGIFNEGNLTITNSQVSNNRVMFTGAGVYNNRGLMTVSGSVFSGNSTGDGAGGGGGLYNDRGVLNLATSTISGNFASNGGGGIGNSGAGAVATIIDSTVSGNTAGTGSTSGGGISNVGTNCVMTVTNSTISNNTAGNGGGISNSFGSVLNLNHSTVSNNRATNYGGGISDGTESPMTNVRNSIIADNTAGNVAQDFSGRLISQGYNLIEDTFGVTIIGTTGNITGQDPQLAPLRNNGGITQTHALQPASPAIDAADPSNFPATDQRGIARPQDGDLNATVLPDIGAYERQVTTFSVTKTLDTDDGICNADCSLREAIATAAATRTFDNAVVFNASQFAVPQTITLTRELQINNAGGTFVINGVGANSLTISGNNQNRVFFINAGASATLSGLRITGGTAANGGSIYNSGNLTVNNSTVTGNNATSFGGGIFNNETATLNTINSIIGNNSANIGGGIFNSTNGNLNVQTSTISGNRAASGYGGGISNNAGTLMLKNSTVSGNNGNGIYNGGVATLNTSTISGNSAPNGGGIFSDLILNINNSTVANNTAVTQGGGIFKYAGTVNLRSSIIARNSAPNAPDFSGQLNSQGFNLIESISGTSIGGNTFGNILGQNPQLAPLRNNGGATATHALLLNSPAIDKGNSVGVNIDQRGQPRPYDFPNIFEPPGGNATDIGAFERQPNEITGSALFDFDGDGKSDISTFRPVNGTWYLLQSQNGFAGIAFGASNDQIIPADYDGDNKTDVAVFRSGTWYLQRSSAGFTGIAFGNAGDIPMPADYDGDGKVEIAVFRPSTGVWYVYNLATNQTTTTVFGQAGDKPVAADYDADGKVDIAVFRSSNGTWYLQRSQLGFTGIVFGESTDKPVASDYDGDGKADIAVFRPSNGVWYLQRSTQGFTGIAFGLGTDTPVPADYDGDGKTDVAVFRNGTWYLNRSTAGFTGIQFGASTDTPVPNAFVR